MGREIEQLCIAKNHNIYSIIDPLLNTDLSSLQGTDIAIEFTQPAAAIHNIRYCIDHNIPVVSGTTGWHDELIHLQAYCLDQKGSFFYSSNFSVGVNLFWKMSKIMTQVMESHFEYGLGLHEIHHDQKKDAPSGTAVTLAQEILSVSHRFNNWMAAPEFKLAANGSIPISSERVGNMPGTHMIEFRSGHDRIALTHEAFSRAGFVAGVVAAAEWLIGKNGVFGMDDLFDALPH